MRFELNWKILMEDSKENSTLPDRNPFRMVRNNFATIGIHPNVAMQSNRFNGKILLGFLIFGTTLTSVWMYTYCVAETFSDYNECIYLGTLITLMTFEWSNIILKMEKMFKLMDEFGNLSKTSERVE